MADGPAGNLSAARPIKPIAIAIGALTLAGVVASPSPLVVLASGSVAVLILVLLWRPNELPILLVPAFYQFTAIALKPIMTAFTGTSLQDFSDFDANLEPAALFGSRCAHGACAGTSLGCWSCAYALGPGDLKSAFQADPRDRTCRNSARPLA